VAVTTTTTHAQFCLSAAGRLQEGQLLCGIMSLKKCGCLWRRFLVMVMLARYVNWVN